MQKPLTEVSKQINPADALMLDFNQKSTRNCEKIKLCCLSHPICGTLLWQSQQTSTVGLRNGTSLRESVCQLAKMSSIHLRYDLAMALPGSRHSQDKTNSLIQTSVCMLSELLFLIAKNWSWWGGEERKKKLCGGINNQNVTYMCNRMHLAIKINIRGMPQINLKIIILN